MTAQPQRYFYDDLQVGMTAQHSRTVSENDIAAYAAVSGDTNPLHLDEAFAVQTQYGARIAHGMLTVSFISAVLGTQLPGPGCVYLSQKVKFVAPVRIGDEVMTTVTVKKLLPSQNQVALKTVATVGNTEVLDGDALVFVPSRDGGSP